MAKVLVVTSGKEKTGKTTIAMNIASALKGLGDKVILIDTEAHLPMLGYDTNIFSNPYTLMDFVKDRIELGSTLREFNGIKYLIGSWNSAEFKEVSTEKIFEIIDKLSPQADYIIFDSAPAEEAMNALAATRELILISRPLIDEVPPLSELNATMNGKRAGVILNMVGKEKLELSTKAIEFLTQMPVVGKIPYDVHILLALSRKKPVVEISPNCPASKGILKFVQEFIKG